MAAGDSGVNRIDGESAGLAGRLLDVLRERLAAPDLTFSAPPERLGGGFWAEMLVLRLANVPAGFPSEVVARVMPDAALARREAVAQTGVVDQGFAAPRVRLTGGPDDAIGRPWSVMDLVAGEPLLAGLSGVAALARLPALARQLPDRLATVTARLHALDARPIRQELEQVTGGEIGVDGLLEHFARRARELDRSDLERVSRWLADHRPSPGRMVVCHGDIHPFNVLADGDRLWLVDWTAAQVAAPEYDVAFTALLLGLPPLQAPRPLGPAIRFAARAVARRFVSRYRHHASGAGIVLDDAALRWHSVLHSLRVLVNVADWIAGGQLEARAGHPWLAMAPRLEARIAGAIA